MTTIHDTIYPRLKTIVSPQDLERVYTPTPDECALAAQVAQDDVAYLGFLIYLKTFQRLGYFVRLPSVPACIVLHIARSVERTEHIGALAAYDQAGTSRRHQARIRAYRGVKPFREGGHERANCSTISPKCSSNGYARFSTTPWRPCSSITTSTKLAPMPWSRRCGM